MLSPSLGAAWFAWAIRGASRLLRRAVGRCRAARMPPTLPFAGAGTGGPRPPLSPPPRNRYSSSSSQQTGLRRRPPRHQRQLALGLLRRYGLQVRQYLRNKLRLLDAGDDLQLPAAARAALYLDTEHSLQPSCPAHRHMPWRRWLGRISARHRRRRCTPAPLRRRHRRPILTVRGKHAVIPGQVHPRRRDQRREARHQIQRLEHNVRRAIPIRRFERVAHLARCRQRQALAGHRRSAHIAAQPFELLTLIRRNVHAGVQGEPARTGGTVRQVMLDSAGAASCTAAIISSAGSDTVTATYSGDLIYASANGTITVAISEAPTVTLT